MVSKTLFLTILAVVALTHGQESPPPPTGDPTPPIATAPPATAPPATEPVATEEPDPACDGIFDIGFIIDSSSSVGADNFQLTREFVGAIVNNLNIGRDQSRVSLARYNSWVDSRFQFNSIFDKAQILESIANTPYYGKGTQTARALNVFASHHLQPYSGWREGRVPTVVIVVTDGRTQDFDMLADAALRLRSKSTRVIAIGVGDEVSINDAELAQIATRPASENVIIVRNFADLFFEVETILTQVCLAEGDINECLAEVSPCDQVCTNTVNGFYCECYAGYTLDVDVTTCLDTNECNNDNGGCSDQCVNTPGSFECQCAVGRILAADGRSCIDDSCFLNNDCAQICNNIVDGTFRCSCRAGFRLDEDGVGCSDINECLVNNGGCEFSCNNTMGSFSCGCPAGEGLRPDGRTCGIQCYSCDRALTNEECDNIVVCAETQRSCQTTTRRENGQTLIYKQCKQTEACANNFIQNPRTAWSPTQCNGGANSDVSVCRCCCHESLCNAPADCTIADEIDIFCPDPALFELPANMNISCTGNRIGDTCDLICPPGFAPVTGDDTLVCSPRPRTLEGFWLGEIGECGDINECLVDNGGCSHTCTNTIGSFECSCPDDNPCANQLLDLYFILDSSSSVGQANFNLMLNFVQDAVAPLTVGQDDVRVGLETYNRRTTPRFDFNEVANNTDFDNKVSSIEYAGRGTRTARAIETAVQDAFRADKGRRAGVPLAVVVITDGRSQDFRRLPRVVEGLHAAASQVFAIGVSNRVNEKELLDIAGGDKSNYVMVTDFSALDADLLSTLGSKICVQPEQRHFLTSDLRNCDVDECAIGNGGCSHGCVNTVGSFTCTCPDGFGLVGNNNVCDEDECLDNNGGCDQICINALLTHRCACESSFLLVNVTQCIDHNECLDENGGCSHGCENLVDGFRCTCPPGFILGADEETCEVDSCFNQQFPFICAQQCINIPGGSYMCQCDSGYSLDEDAHNCTELNECDMANGGCEHTCVNTPGSFFCECPEGFALRDDGKTCGIVCYTCQNVLENEECNLPVACAVSQDACFTTMRTRDNVTRIFKGCQQTEACVNNLIQNLRESGEGPSQCNRNLQNSKCECCCLESFCNADLCPYNFTLPGCPSFDQEDVMFYGLQDNGEVFPGGSARVVCAEGFTFASGGVLLTQLNCNYNFQNETAEWDGSPEDLDSCTDIDECAENNGGCVEPAICVNLPGSFECVCPEVPDDYVLIDDFVCERDECADPDQGGCSHNCTNTIGSYQCQCPNGYSLLEDGLTCDFNECADANGGCAQICNNILGGFECLCQDGYTIGVDGRECVDVDECLTDNGGCSHICTNLVPGYECSCPENMLLNDDGFTCRENPCFVDNGGCGQICTALEIGFECSCAQGYELLEDGSCIDINECLNNNAGCQYNCTNFDGGFTCECPAGEALRPDGRNCGRACYSCQNAATNEECNAQPLEVCPSDADACENQVRVHSGIKRIFKRCKQSKSCNNNFIQNPRLAFLPTQCNNDDANDVCRCCCTGHLCNFNEKPCQAQITCNANLADVVIVLDSSSSVKFDNFQIMKSFTSSLFQTFRLGPNRVHAALLRYNNQQDERFGLANTNDRDEVIDAVESVPYRGRGTLTGAALTYVRENILREENGARPGVPKIVITLTDGLSQDNVGRPSQALRDDGVTTFAVGIGSSFMNNPAQLEDIAGADDRLFVVQDFQDLSGTILNTIQESICHDDDECATANGGCSDECVNTQGSFFCRCPDGSALGDDLRTCIAGLNASRAAADECADNNGGCSQICQDFLIGYNCSCNEGYELGIDLRTCFDADECTNSPCSHSCVNTIGGFFCECPEDFMITADRYTCVRREGVADCPSGYDAAGHSCTRIINALKIDYPTAQADCDTDGGRLVKIADEGNLLIFSRKYNVASWIGLTGGEDSGFTFSDGTPMMFPAAWADGQPSGDGCVYLNQRFFVSPCEADFYAICELPRATALVVFSRTWPNGAQGKLYFPTDVNTVKVTFPAPIKEINVWFGSVARKINNREFVISQNDNERQSGMGQAEFVLEMRGRRFPSYDVEVEEYVMA